MTRKNLRVAVLVIIAGLLVPLGESNQAADRRLVLPRSRYPGIGGDQAMISLPSPAWEIVMVGATRW